MCQANTYICLSKYHPHKLIQTHLWVCYVVAFLPFKLLASILLFCPQTLVLVFHVLRLNFCWIWFHVLHQSVLLKGVPLLYALYYVWGYVILKLFTLPQFQALYLGLCSAHLTNLFFYLTNLLNVQISTQCQLFREVFANSCSTALDTLLCASISIWNVHTESLIIHYYNHRYYDFTWKIIE